MLSSFLSVGTLNICGLRHKITEVSDLLNSHDLGIICLTETKLSSEVSGGELQFRDTSLSGMTEIILVGEWRCAIATLCGYAYRLREQIRNYCELNCWVDVNLL